MDVVAATKRYVSDDRYKLRLFDTVATETRRVMDVLREDRFAVTSGWSEPEFRTRITAFDELCGEHCRIETLMGQWGSDAAADTLTLPIRRLCDQLQRGNGITRWLEVQWYPVVLLFYAAGITVVAAGRYGLLSALMHVNVRDSGKDEPLVTAVTEGLSDRTRPFKLLEGHEKHKVPFSEHVFNVLRPALDEMLFLGSDYERAFDRFEALYAIEFAHKAERGWGPVGRFGYKIHGDSSPLLQLMEEAEAAGNAWPPVVAGLFAGSIDRFKTVAKAVAENVARSHW